LRRVEDAVPEIAAMERIIRIFGDFFLFLLNLYDVKLRSRLNRGFLACFAQGWDGPDKRRRWIAGSSKTIFAELLPTVEE